MSEVHMVNHHVIDDLEVIRLISLRYAAIVAVGESSVAKVNDI